MCDGSYTRSFESAGIGFTLGCDFGNVVAAYGKRKGASAVMVEMIAFLAMAKICKTIAKGKPHISLQQFRNILTKRIACFSTICFCLHGSMQ